jgi:hypothetical protein
MYIVKINPVEINVFNNGFVIIACGCKHVGSRELPESAFLSTEGLYEPNK